MRAVMTSLVPLLEASPERLDIVADLTAVESFSPSVLATAQVAVWDTRRKIGDVLLFGGPLLVRAMWRGGCLVLGVPCRMTESLPHALASAIVSAERVDALKTLRPAKAH